MERLQAIYDETEDWDTVVVSDFAKLQLAFDMLSKISKDISVTPAHDQFFIGFKDESHYDKLTDEEIRTLFLNGWFVEEDALSTFL